MKNVRALAAKTVYEVATHGRSLSNLLPPALERCRPRDRALLQELCYGALRYYFRLNSILQQQMSKPLKPKDRDIEALLIVGLYQLLYMRTPGHAAVSETVSAVQELKKGWAKGLTNGVLRNCQRNLDELQSEADNNFSSQYAHPEWLIERLQLAWPEQWQQIVTENNQYPPMTLRVNQHQQSREQYLQLLTEQGIETVASDYAAAAITLNKPQDVNELPCFAEGGVSVQDGAAQLSAQLLAAQPGERVLDACAAPGGKSCHILESQSQLAELVAAGDGSKCPWRCEPSAP